MITNQISNEFLESINRYAREVVGKTLEFFAYDRYGKLVGHNFAKAKDHQVSMKIEGRYVNVVRVEVYNDEGFRLSTIRFDVTLTNSGTLTVHIPDLVAIKR